MSFQSWRDAFRKLLNRPNNPSSEPKPVIQENPADEQLVMLTLAEDDTEIQLAIHQAQSTLDDFIRALNSPTPNRNWFSIKARFAYGPKGATEHIWLDDVALVADRMAGKIGNPPISATWLRYEEVVTVPLSDVTDWMYVEDGNLVGGYTIRVMWHRMLPEQRQQLEQSVGKIITE